VKIEIIDNGSIYISKLHHLLAGREIHKAPGKNSLIVHPANGSVILSGGGGIPIVGNEGVFQSQMDLIKNTEIPLIGICLGAELIAYTYGVKLNYSKHRTKGLVKIYPVKQHSIFAGISEYTVYENHKWAIPYLPDDFEILAMSERGIEVFRHKKKPLFGLQFHPELIDGDNCGAQIFNNILGLAEFVEKAK